MEFDAAVLSALVTLSLVACSGTAQTRAAETRPRIQDESVAQEAQRTGSVDGDRPSDIRNESVSLEPLLVPFKVSVLEAAEDSVACVHFDRGRIFDTCRAKRVYAQLKVKLTHSRHPRDLRHRSLQGGHMEACGPVGEPEENGYLCFRYGEEEVSAGSNIGFRRLLISLMVLDCRGNFRKFTSRSYNLKQVSVETKALHTARVNVCPGTTCREWLAREGACPFRVAGIRGPPRNAKRGIESLLIVALAVSCGLLAFALAQTTKCVRPRIYTAWKPSSRTVPEENCLHLSAKDSSSDTKSPMALARTGAEGHRETPAT